MTKRVLVIGGAGFIGSNLLQQLSKNNGTELFSLDDYSNGRVENHVDNVVYLKGDASAINDLIEFEINEIYHFGEYSRVEQSFADPLGVIENNCSSMLPVLRFSKKNNAKLLYSASSTVFSEKSNNISLSPYTLSKEINVLTLNSLAAWMGIDYRIVYFYNVYGPREVADGKNSTLIAKYLRLKTEGSLKLPVNGDGKQKRNFTHIDDVVRGLCLVMDKGYGDGYGIGCDDAFSVLEVVKMFKCEPEFFPNPLGNRSNAPMKNEKMKSLGWQAEKRLPDYIKAKI